MVLSWAQGTVRVIIDEHIAECAAGTAPRHLHVTREDHRGLELGRVPAQVELLAAEVRLHLVRERAEPLEPRLRHTAVPRLGARRRAWRA